MLVFSQKVARIPWERQAVFRTIPSPSQADSGLWVSKKQGLMGGCTPHLDGIESQWIYMWYTQSELILGIVIIIIIIIMLSSFLHTRLRSLSPTSFSLLLGKCQAPHKMGLSGTHFQSVEKVIARLFCCPCLIPPVNASFIPNVVGLHHQQGQSFVSLPLRSTGRYGLLGNLLSLNVSPWKQVAKTISFYNIDG